MNYFHLKFIHKTRKTLTVHHLPTKKETGKAS